MTLALEVVGLHKRFTAGIGSCLATNAVLRGVDLELERGEVAAIAGAPGSGKSTLLLCIAGLLAADHGTVRRFGDESRDAAARCTRHYMSCEQLWRWHASSEGMVHLVDLSDFSALQLGRLRCWFADRIGSGDAAILAAHSVDLARNLAGRILTLSEGRLLEAARARARVAETRFVDRPFERV